MNTITLVVVSVDVHDHTRRRFDRRTWAPKTLGVAKGVAKAG